MNELGFVITKSGEIIKFGEYNSFLYRDRENSKHYHNTSFREVLKENKEKFDFISDKDNFEIVHSLSFIAENDCVSLLNATQGGFEPSIQIGVMTVPEKPTDVIKKSLLLINNIINYFDDGLLYINVIDHEGNILCEYNSADDFYREYVGADFVIEDENKSYVKQRRRAV